MAIILLFYIALGWACVLLNAEPLYVSMTRVSVLSNEVTFTMKTNILETDVFDGAHFSFKENGESFDITRISGSTTVSSYNGDKHLNEITDYYEVQTSENKFSRAINLPNNFSKGTHTGISVSLKAAIKDIEDISSSFTFVYNDGKGHEYSTTGDIVIYPALIETAELRVSILGQRKSPFIFTTGAYRYDVRSGQTITLDDNHAWVGSTEACYVNDWISVLTISEDRKTLSIPSRIAKNDTMSIKCHNMQVLAPQELVQAPIIYKLTASVPTSTLPAIFDSSALPFSKREVSSVNYIIFATVMLAAFTVGFVAFTRWKTSRRNRVALLDNDFLAESDFNRIHYG